MRLSKKMIVLIRGPPVEPSSTTKSRAARSPLAPRIRHTTCVMLGQSFPRFINTERDLLMCSLWTTLSRICVGRVADVTRKGIVAGTKDRRRPNSPNAFRKFSPHSDTQWASSITMDNTFRVNSGVQRSFEKCVSSRHISGDVMMILYLRDAISCI